MAEVTEQHVLDALKEVTDPDKQQDVVSLGMVTGLQIKDGHVAFAIEVDADRGPHMEPVRRAAEKAVHGLPGVLSATVVLTAERPAGGPAARCAGSGPRTRARSGARGADSGRGWRHNRRGLGQGGRRQVDDGGQSGTWSGRGWARRRHHGR